MHSCNHDFSAGKVSCQWQGYMCLQGEHTVIAVLTGWTVVIYGATQAFGGKKKDAPAAAPPPAPAPEKVVAEAEAVVTEVKETAAKAVSTGIDSVQKSIDAVAEGK